MNTTEWHLLMQVSAFPESEAPEQQKVDSVFYRINNVLCGADQLPNIKAICNYCEENRKELGVKIRREIATLKKESSVYHISSNNVNSIFNSIEMSEKCRLRVLLYPGSRDSIEKLKLNEATHNMILQFDSSKPNFVPTEPHNNYPIFYQVCNSVDIAALYIEALLIDACMCHYMMVSDAAPHHDDKQQISSEKVLFLREICANNDIGFFSEPAKNLIKKVSALIREDTPYVSFLSIFTVALDDVSINDSDSLRDFFNDYCKLWSHFQKWFFKKHGRMFSKSEGVGNPIERLFDRNKYQGQISPEEAKTGIENILSQHNFKSIHGTSEYSNGYSFVILRKMPKTLSHKRILESLFVNQLHQAKWQIIPWNRLDEFEPVYYLIETVPFMVCE